MSDNEDVVEEIHTDFYSGSGTCEGCLRRDDDCYATPTYGYGSDDADVMLIGEASGGSKTIRKEDRDLHTDRRRTWKNYQETGYSYEYTPNETPRESIQDLNIPELNYLIEILSREHDLYYTNVAKCGDIREPIDGNSHIPKKYRYRMNGHGKKNCLNHLLREINVIQPEAIIVFGNSKSKDNYNHLELVFKELSLEEFIPSGSSVHNYVYNNQYTKSWTNFSVYPAKEYECAVIPSYHFSYNFMYAKGEPYSEEPLGYPSKEYNKSSERYPDELKKAVSGIVS